MKDYIDLIPIEQFIDEVENYVLESNNYKRGCKLIFDRRELGKKPLELGFFIPCDKDGNVLEKPKQNLTSLSNNKKKEEYQQALERVLIPGFEIVVNKPHAIRIINGTVDMVWDKQKKCFLGRQNTTLDDLTDKGLKIKKP